MAVWVSVEGTRVRGDGGSRVTRHTLVARLLGTLMLVASIGGGGTSLLSVSGGLAEEPSSEHFAVLYTTEQLIPGAARHYRREILWQRGVSAQTARVVYRSQDSIFAHSIPDMMGFLPSPDGRLMHVWETVLDRHMVPVRTEWWVVGLPDARRELIGQVAGAAGVLPYWESGDRLLLERGATSAVVDTRGRQLRVSQALSRVAGPGGDTREVDAGWSPKVRTWTTEYLRRHYRSQLACLKRALSRGRPDLGIERYLVARGSPPADTAEDFLLRPLGIVNTDPTMAAKMNWPEVSFSPDRGFIACAMVTVTNKTSQDRSEDGRPRYYWGAQARLDVYDVASGRRIWEKTAPWDARIIAYEGEGLPVAEYSPRYDEEPFFCDLRWSPDGRYLSFTASHGEREPTDLVIADMGAKRVDSVSVVDTETWREVLRIPDARGAFVVPLAAVNRP
jgi:hypothetical protein